MTQTLLVTGASGKLGHHPCGAPYGFEMSYLNAMAGPQRKWRFVPAPEIEWIMERDA